MNRTRHTYSSRTFVFCAITLLLNLAGIAVFSQDKTINALTAKLEDYSSKHLQEKLFLHTDKEFYVAGEIIWFRIYYVDAIFNKPLDISKVAYAEILDKDNKPVLQQKIVLKKGGGQGSFYLPLTLASGSYKLRSYTNWMKNFSSEFFFEKAVTVVNTMKAAGASSKNDSAAYHAAFFPEGGNLVNNVESKVAFRVTDLTGKGADARGFILNSKNDTLLSFQTSKFGIGYFIFKPSDINTYRAILVFPGGRSIEQSLPTVNEKGYIMRVAGADDQKIRVTVNTNAKTNSQYKEVFILVHTRQVLKFAEKAHLDNNGAATIFIDRSKLGEGITQITVFNEEGRPVCERLYFIKPLKKITLVAKTGDEIYSTRKKVNLSVAAKDKAGEGLPADVSVSVFQLDSLQQTDNANIFTYLWLSSELKGRIESPGYYFSDDPGVEEATDNLMLTHGWRRFRWEDVLSTEKAVVAFPPEYNGAVISARVINARSNGPAADKQVFLSIPGVPFRFYASSSDANGIVSFEVKDRYDYHDIIFQVNDMVTDRSENAYRIELISPFADMQTEKNFSSFSSVKSMQNLLLNRSIGMQVQNVYTADSIRKFQLPVIADTLPFFNYPGRTYFLDDYKRFTTMEEVLREYIAEINVVVKNGKQHLKLMNESSKEFYDQDILVLLDGVPLQDKDKIFSFDPIKVRKIDIIPKGYVMGPSYFRSMASFSTYDADFKAVELNPGLVIVNYEGLQMQREFYSPVYETQQQQSRRIPDFRNTIFWSPALTTDNKGEAKVQFYTSDQKGIYIAVVEGIGENGDAAATSFTFEVK
jgi:hypothetical protein